MVNGPESVELTQVEIAYLDGAYAMITSGIEDGDLVVIDGGPFIVKGSKIVILNNDDTQVNLSQASAH